MGEDKIENIEKSGKPGSLKQKLIADWKGRNPILKFAVLFGLLMAIFYGFWHSEIFVNNILTPVVNVNAWIAASILNLCGYSTAAIGSEILAPHYSISIKKGCDALEPMAIFVFAVSLFPTAFSSKRKGLAIGIPALFIVNQIRIISLFLIGLYGPRWFGDSSVFFFDIMHMQVWQTIFIIITLLFLLYWITWAIKRERSQLTQPHAEA